MPIPRRSAIARECTRSLDLMRSGPRRILHEGMNTAGQRTSSHKKFYLGRVDDRHCFSLLCFEGEAEWKEEGEFGVESAFQIW